MNLRILSNNVDSSWRLILNLPENTSLWERERWVRQSIWVKIRGKIATLTRWFCVSCVVSHFAFVLLAACLRANNMRAGKGRARERGQVFGWEHLCISFNLVQFWSELRRELKEFAPCSCLAPIARGWDWQKSRDGEREKFHPSQLALVYTLRISRPPHLFCVTMQGPKWPTKIWWTLRYLSDTQIWGRCPIFSTHVVQQFNNLMWNTTTLHYFYSFLFCSQIDLICNDSHEIHTWGWTMKSLFLAIFVQIIRLLPSDWKLDWPPAVKEMTMWERERETRKRYYTTYSPW